MSDMWRPIPGYEGSYEVSSSGLVQSVARKVPHGRGNAYRNIKERLLSSNPANNGYPSVMLSEKGKKKLCTVHRLVMLAFAGPCPDGMEVAHADGNRLNSKLENLRYATRQENMADAVKHGTTPHGHKNGGAKLSPAQVLAIRSDARPLAKIAAEYGISKSTVFNAKNHKTYAK
jgi:hypothetical protein